MGLFKTFGSAYFRRPNVRIHGLENLPKAGPYIVAANHPTFLEPVVLALLIYRHTGQKPYFLTKHVVYTKLRWFGLPRLARLIDVPIKDKARSLEPAATRLKQGAVLVVFPEGTRNLEPSLLQGRTGVIRAAVAGNVPIIPIGYTGPTPVGRIESFVVFWKRRLPVDIRIGQAIHLPQPTEPMNDWLRQQTDQLMHVIASLAGKTYVV